MIGQSGASLRGHRERYVDENRQVRGEAVRGKLDERTEIVNIETASVPLVGERRSAVAIGDDVLTEGKIRLQDGSDVLGAISGHDQRFGALGGVH